MGKVSPLVWVFLGVVVAGFVVSMGFGIHRLFRNDQEKPFAHRSAEQEQYMADVRMMNLKILEHEARQSRIRPKAYAGPA
jgi:hypothetical protein